MHDVDFSDERFFADMPSLPTTDGGVGSSSSFLPTGDGGAGCSSSVFMDVAYDPSTFFGSCVEEFVVSLDQDVDAPMTEPDTGVASQEPAAEPSLQHDAPAREDPPPDRTTHRMRFQPSRQHQSHLSRPHEILRCRRARFCAATSIIEDIIS